MKNQYFGDQHDYIKYAFIRRMIQGNGVRTAVCWMLTPPGNRNDGRYIGYLRGSQSCQWRRIDTPLFDCLKSAVHCREERNVEVIKRSGLLHDTIFYPDELPGTATERQEYFRGFRQLAAGRDLVFFDADNGLKDPSATYEERPSIQHLYPSDLVASFKNGHSLLVYQHRQRNFLKKENACNLKANLFNSVEGAYHVDVFFTGYVAFALVTHPRHVGRFTNQIAEVRAEIQQGHWEGRLYSLLRSSR